MRRGQAAATQNEGDGEECPHWQTPGPPLKFGLQWLMLPVVEPEPEPEPEPAGIMMPMAAAKGRMEFNAVS